MHSSQRSSTALALVVDSDQPAAFAEQITDRTKAIYLEKQGIDLDLSYRDDLNLRKLEACNNPATR